MREKKIKMLAWSDAAVVQTGFGVVSKYVLKGLYGTGNYEIDQLAINYHGDFYDREECPYQLVPAKIGNPRDPYGLKMFGQSLVKNKYDIVWILNDTFVVQPVANVLDEVRKAYLDRGETPPMFVYYYPVDCKVLPNYAGMIDKADVPVAYTEFGINETLKVLPHVEGRLEQIYHGVNTSVIHPISKAERARWRKAYLKVNDDTFVITNVNRNSVRKQIPHTLLAFKEFKKLVPNSVLYLHTVPKDGGIDLLQACKDLQLSPVKDVIFPANYSPSRGFPEEVLNRFFCCSDAFLTTHLGEGFGLCVHPETLIDTLEKFAHMREVKVGDRVLTEDGTYREVVDKISREDKVLEVDVFGTPNTLVTPQHPFLAVKAEGRSRRSAVRACDFDRPEWTRGSDLKKGDFVAIVKPKDCSPMPEDVDLVQWVDGVEYDDEYVWCKMGFSPHSNGLSISDIQRQYGVSKRVAEDARRCVLGTSLRSRGLPGSRAFEVAEKIASAGLKVNDKILKIKRFVKIDDDFLSFVGWYIAEGSNGNGRTIELDLHIDELPIANKLGQFLARAFGVIPVIEENGKKKCRCYCSSQILSLFMAKYCGAHAQNKKIHSSLSSCYSRLLPLLRGILVGDGYLAKNKVILSMTSREVVWQVRNILLANNVFCSVNGPYHRGKHLEQWVLSVAGEDHKKLCDLLGLEYGYVASRKRAQHYVETERYFFARVRSVKDAGTSEVMDVSVRDVHSFVGNGLLLHNTVAEAMAAEVPVIAPDNTNMYELLGKIDADEKRGWLYPCKDMVWVDNSGYRPAGRIEDIVSSLLDVYKKTKMHDPELNLRTKRAREWCVEHDWSNIGKQWVKLFDRKYEEYLDGQLKTQASSVRAEEM